MWEGVHNKGKNIFGQIVFLIFAFLHFQSHLKIHVFDKHILQGYSRDDLKQFDQEAKEKVLELMREFGLYQVVNNVMIIIISIS